MNKPTNTDVRALSKGTRLYEYKLESVLGHGGFGITYLATDLSLEQKVAIKEYYPRDFAVRDRTKTVHATGNAEDRENFEWGLDRFREEARTLARFSHPNVVAVRRLFEANGTSYIVMDFCEGEPLDQIIRRSAPLPEKQLVGLFLALLDALEHVHSANVMHRDIKPANIFIRDDGSPVLLDFGAARQALVNHSQSMTSLATAHYAAFEQYSTQGNQGPWTDIYGLAATCYHAATGEKPLDAPDRILNDKLQPLLVKAAGRYSHEFLKAIDAGLAVRPEDRPQSIAAWRNVFAYGKKLQSAAIAAPAKPVSPANYNAAIIGFAISFVFVALIWIGQAVGDSDARVVTEDTEATANVTAPEYAATAVTDATSAEVDQAVDEARQAQVAAKIAARGNSCPDPSEEWDNCEGEFTFEDGNRFVGEWGKNNPSGYGIYYFKDGSRYEGKLVDGKIDGYGVYLLNDGSRIEGAWSQGEVNGYSITVDSQGNIMQSGFYKNGSINQ